MNLTLKCFLLLTLLIMVITRGDATVRYVSSAGSNTNDGLTWQTSKATIQAALNDALSGDQVWVAAGVYYENIYINTSVELYGGFLLGQTLVNRNFRANISVIDASGSAGYNSVIQVPANQNNGVTIDGFTITGGNAHYGGGINVQNVPITIRNNNIINNKVIDQGAGVYISYLVYNNPAIIQILNNIISNNDGIATFQGGGLYIINSQGAIANNLIYHNGYTLNNGGGGLEISFGYPTIVNNTIVSNRTTTSTGGGGIWVENANPTIANNIVANNSIGGIYVNNSSSSIFRNDLFNNLSQSGVLKNYSGYLSGASFTSNSLDIQLDPKFVSGSDFHLQANSPAIDAGDNIATLQYIFTDIDGNPRILDSTVDIGVYEYLIGTAQTLAPVISPTHGASNSQVTITSPSSSAVIYYTLDGTNPTINSPSIPNGGTVYIPSGIIFLKAAAKAPNLSLSYSVTGFFRDPFIVYVNEQTGSDINNGLSWITAKRSINSALQVANYSGDQVWVSMGIYHESIILNPGISLYGGFLTGQNLSNRNFLANHSTIDASLLAGENSVITISNNAGNDAIIDGFTIKGGKGKFGAGINILYSTPTIRNCNITLNSYSHTGGSGGGIYAIGTPNNGQSLLIENNYITNNGNLGLSSTGGGIALVNINALLVNNVIAGQNNNILQGGGIWISGSSNISIKLINNTLTNNIAGDGGGIYINGTPNIYLANSIIAFNTSSSQGQNIFSQNLINISSSHNDVFSNPGVADVHNIQLGSADLSYDPQFINLTSYIVSSASSTVDTGDDAAYFTNFPAADVNGNIRIKFNHIDIGAAENQTVQSQTPAPIITPPGGISPSIVHVFDVNPSAIIYYNINGANPTTASASIANGGSISIPAGIHTLKVIAVAPGLTASSVTSAYFRSVPAVIFVSGLYGNNNNDGTTWYRAKKTINSGLAAAFIAGDQVWVESGTYNERIQLNPGISLYGGFLNGQSLSNRNFISNVSIIGGLGNGSIITVLPGAGNDTVIDGFTISGGNSSGGAGIMSIQSSPTIQNNTVTANSISGVGNGAGIFINGGLSSGQPAVIQKNIIKNNVSSGYVFGGGIAVSFSSANIVNNVISGSSASTLIGGGLWLNGDASTTINVINNTIANNIANFGGGIFIDGSPKVNIVNNIFVNNTAPFGSAVYASSSSTAIISHNDFYPSNASNFYNVTLGTENLFTDPQFISPSNYQLRTTSPLIDAGDNSYYLSTYSATDYFNNPRIQGASIDIGAFEGGIDVPVLFKFTVKLQGYVGQTLPTVQLTIDGGPLLLLNLTQTSTGIGSFTLQLLLSSSHTIKIKPDKFLSQTAILPAGVTSFIFDGGARTNYQGLIPGDDNGDNIINDLDLLEVINNFLKPGVSAVDFNGDNIIDEIDLLDVINNFLAQGN